MSAVALPAIWLHTGTTNFTCILSDGSYRLLGKHGKSPIPVRMGVMDVRSIGQVVVRVKAASKSQRMQLLCTSALLARVWKSITLMLPLYNTHY